jgi:hypothetical protein
MWINVTLCFMCLPFTINLFLIVVRDSSVGVVPRCGLDGPEIEYQCGEIFFTRSEWPWGPPSLLYKGYWVFFPEVK